MSNVIEVGLSYIAQGFKGFPVKPDKKSLTAHGLKDAKSITMKNGKPATQGVCPSCGTKMFRIGKS